MALQSPLKVVLFLFEVPLAASIEVSSPGLTVSFEPLDVFQQARFPKQWDPHAAGLLSGFSYEGVDASVSRAFQPTFEY